MKGGKIKMAIELLEFYEVISMLKDKEFRKVSCVILIGLFISKTFNIPLVSPFSIFSVN